MSVKFLDFAEFYLSFNSFQQITFKLGNLTLFYGVLSSCVDGFSLVGPK